MKELNVNEVCKITDGALAMFIGSEVFYRHPLAKTVLFTEGCAYLCENGAAWLIDAIASYQIERRLQKEEFQSWTLTVNRKDQTADLVCTDGGIGDNPPKVIVRQGIPYTDFPLETIRLFCCANGIEPGGHTIMLAGEY